MLKYQEAKEIVAEKLKKLTPGQPLPPFRTLMRELGYSQITLKRAFEELENEGGVVRKRGAGMFAPGVKSNRNLVGVIMPHLVPKMNSQMLVGIEEYLSSRDCNLLLLSSRGTGFEEIFKSVTANRLSKLIVSLSSADLSKIGFIDLLHKITEHNVEVVIIDVPVPGLRAGYVGMENISVFHRVAKEITAKGARNIVAIGSFASKVYSARLEGIRSGIDDPNVKLRQIDIDGASLAETARETASLRPDAIILSHAGKSVDLTYELRCIMSDDIKHIQFAGIVEQGERIPLEHAVTLEKQSIEMGRTAAEMALTKSNRPQIQLLPIKYII